MNKLIDEFFMIKHSYNRLSQYKNQCMDLDEKLYKLLDLKTIDFFILKKLINDMYKQRIGSSQTISKALQRLIEQQQNNIRYQQQILALAAKHNLCQSTPVNFQLEQINSQNFNPEVLLYFALTENNGLVNFCEYSPIKHKRMYYYLQYILPNYDVVKDQYILFQSNKQKEYELKIDEEYIKEYEIGLYHIDFYLPKSNTAIEINGNSHYIHFQERRTGIYQQKYNFLLKKGLKIKEITQFE